MKTIIISLLLATVALPAMATNPGNNGGGNGGCGVGQTTNGCGGTGGAGGAGGSAIQGQAQGQAQGQIQGQSSYNRNTNTNVNANSNSNRNTATGGNAAGGNSNATGGNASSNQSQSVDNSGAGSNSNNYQQSGIPVSSAVAPSFAIGGCQWAISGGIQFFGTGVSGGGAGMYEFCKGLMKAKHFREVGNVGVATALECQDSSIRAAYKEAGQPCAADMPRQVAANGAPPAPVIVNSSLPANCTTQTVGGKSFVTCQ
jgi:hypothetical protein